MNTEKKDFICTDVDNGAIYMNVELGGGHEFVFDIRGQETEGNITLSKYDASDLARFIQKQFYYDKGNEITEEWLLQYGFEEKFHFDEKYFVLFGYNRSKLMAFKAPHDSKMRVNLRVYDVEASRPIYYINDLKNIYFLLTGNELMKKP